MKNTSNEYKLLAAVYRQLGQEYTATDSLVANRYFEDSRYIEKCAERGERLPENHMRNILAACDAVRDSDIYWSEWKEVQDIRQWHIENSHR
jgi:hypothetical protein